MSETDNQVPVPEQEPNHQLYELAARVRDAHKVVLAAVANALAAALDAGDAVLALQQELHGREIGWQAWFREWGNLPLSTAKFYAQLAAHRDEIEAARARFPELSLRAARRLISKPQDEPPAASTNRTEPAPHEALVPADPETDLEVALDNVTFEQCFQAISSYSQPWRDALEQRVIEGLSVEQLLKLVESKIELTPKTRAALKDLRKAPPRSQLELRPNSDKSTQVVTTNNGTADHAQFHDYRAIDEIFRNYKNKSLEDLENSILKIQRATGRGAHPTPAQWNKVDRMRARAAELKRDHTASVQAQGATP